MFKGHERVVLSVARVALISQLAIFAGSTLSAVKITAADALMASTAHQVTASKKPPLRFDGTRSIRQQVGGATKSAIAKGRPLHHHVTGGNCAVRLWMRGGRGRFSGSSASQVTALGPLWLHCAHTCARGPDVLRFRGRDRCCQERLRLRPRSSGVGSHGPSQLHLLISEFTVYSIGAHTFFAWHWFRGGFMLSHRDGLFRFVAFKAAIVRMSLLCLAC